MENGKIVNISETSMSAIYYNKDAFKLHWNAILLFMKLFTCF